jgi:hypothetical protein
MDLLMDIDNTRDLVFANGACPVTQFPVQTVAQRLFIRLRTFKGEWFYNTTYGIPYFQRVFTKTTKSAVDAIFQDQILSETGVKRITEFTSNLNSANRRYTLSFRVLTTSGQESETITIN